MEEGPRLWAGGLTPVEVSMGAVMFCWPPKMAGLQIKTQGVLVIGIKVQKSSV